MKNASLYRAARKRAAKAAGIVWRLRPRDNSKEQRGGQIVRPFNIDYSSVAAWRRGETRYHYNGNGKQECARRLRQMGAA